MKKNYERLKEIQAQYPELTFDNIGYQYLSREVQESHAEIIQEVESILRGEIKNFVKFFNFKPRKDGSIAVRCDYIWDPTQTHFVGVGYFPIEDFLKEGETL